VVRNSVSREVVEIERQGGTFDDVRHLVAGARGRRVYETGDPEAGIWWSGVAQGLIDDIPSVGDLVTRIVGQAEELISGRLARAARPTAAA
jgi:nitronate monooxygenase